MDYEEVIRKIIEKQEETIGMIAKQRAKSVDSIDIEDDEITFNESPDKQDVEDLMEEYKEIQGKGAVGIARKAMSNLLDEDSNLDLPEEIVPKEVKKDQLADAI